MHFKIASRFGVLTKHLIRSQSSLSYVHAASTVPLVNDTIHGQFRKSVEEVPDRQLFVFSQQNIRRTYSQVYQDVQLRSVGDLARGFMHLGMKQNDRVAIWAPNYYEWVVVQLAAAASGLILVGVSGNRETDKQEFSPAYQASELKYALKKVGVKMLILPVSSNQKFSSTLVNAVPEIRNSSEDCGAVKCSELPELKHVVVFENENTKLRGAWQFNELQKAGGSTEQRLLNEIEKKLQTDEAANIEFTSVCLCWKPFDSTVLGNNWQPKSSCFISPQHCEQRELLWYQFEIRSRAVCNLCAQSIVSLFRLCCGKSGTLNNSADALTVMQRVCFRLPPLIHLPQSKPRPKNGNRKNCKLKRVCRCTTIYGTPTMFIDILNTPTISDYDLSATHTALVAGAPVPPSLVSELTQRTQLHNIVIGYGCTELTTAVSLSRANDSIGKRMKSVGHVIPHLELCIKDSEGRTVNGGEAGEICVRGLDIGNQNERLRSRTDGITQDVGCLNEDESLSVVGRLKDMIIRGGENIYPAEIENLIANHPHVRDVQVVGIPDDRLGEEVCAVVQLKTDVSMNEAELKAYCRQRISHFKVPRHILFKSYAFFPRTLSGKIQKNVLVQLCLEELKQRQTTSEHHFIDQPEVSLESHKPPVDLKILTAINENPKCVIRAIS
ncbi:hypothetical protein M3Y94_00114800 [Aphelenchoides besseyi]|nr:hypothetical protein M3Y94_00114800 [Aphelenchoides besseyi]